MGGDSVSREAAGLRTGWGRVGTWLVRESLPQEDFMDPDELLDGPPTETVRPAGLEPTLDHQSSQPTSRPTSEPTPRTDSHPKFEIGRAHV